MTSILIFLVVLGLLIFFHELGHFVAAKACGIYCDRFSLGMPPRVFGVRLGETDYCIGLLPIGGYVKMAGQEDVPLSEEERDAEFGHVPPERWYMNKPVWQRMIVIAAGPLMNVVLAVLLYAIVAGIGADVPESTVDNRIGAVRANSPAAEARLHRVMDAEETPDAKAEPDAFGWQTGDRILSINGKRVDGFVDVAFGAVLSGGDPVQVVIEREQPDGTSVLYASTVRPEKAEDSDIAQFGVAPFETALVSSVMEGSPAALAGLQPDDVITRLNGKTIDQATIIETLAGHADGSEVEVEVLRNDHTLSLSMKPDPKGKIQDIVFDPPRQWMSLLDRLETLSVTHEDDDALRESGLKKGDTITRIGDAEASAELLRDMANEDMAQPLALTVTRKTGLFGLGGVEELSLSGVPLQDVLQAVTPFDIFGQPRIAGISDETKEATGLQRDDVLTKIDGQPATIAALRELEQANAGGEISVTVQRPAIAGGAVQQEETLDATIPVAKVGQIGVIFGTKMVFHKATAGQILPEAIRLTWRDVDRIMLTIQKLVTGGLSPKNLGGPVMIFNVTTEAAQHGLNWLLKITAFISVNLAIFNLLPLPVLDGGHLVFLTLEAVRRKPAPPKLLEWVQQAGVVLIIFLILFVTYNDIRRLVVDFLP